MKVLPLSVQTYVCLFHDTGVKSVTMNVHLLSHVAECVYNWGPLWCYSCFSFESMNREVKLMFHGSQDMTKQVSLYISFPFY